MNGHPIDDLLNALDDTLPLDPALDTRIRDRVTIELRGDSVAPTTPADGTTEVRFSVVDGSPGADGPERESGRRRQAMLAIAAALVLTLAAALTLVVANRSEQVPADTVPDVDQSPEPDPNSIVGARFSTGRPDTAAVATGGANPHHVAVGEHVWVMSLDGRLVRLDPATLEVTADVTVSESSLIAAGHGALWVADAIRGTVVRFDENNATFVATIETGIQTRDNAFRTGGLPLLGGQQREFARIGSIAVAGDWVWVGDQDGRVLRIDPDLDEVVGAIDVDIDADLVVADDRYVAVVGRDEAEVIVFEISTGDAVLRTGRLTPPVGADLQDVGASLYGGSVYVHVPADGTATKIDLTTGRQVVSDPLGASATVGGVPFFPPVIEVSDAGVLAATAGGLVALDPETLAVERRFDEFDLRAAGMTIDPDGTAWIVEYWPSALTQLVPGPD